MDAADTLRSLTSLDDGEQLAALASVVSTLDDRDAASRLMRPLLDTLERFPFAESHGLFWSVLHALERVPGYEAAVVESVRRSPGEFNLLMIGRILNSGTEQVGHVNLRELLSEVASSAKFEQARQAARSCLSDLRDEAR